MSSGILSRKLLGFAVLGGCIGAGASLAQGAEHGGYVAVSGGYVIPSGSIDEKDVTSDSGTALPDDTVDIKDGWDVGLAIGVFAAEHCRVEFQYTGQFNDLDSITFDDFKSSADGTVYSNLFMVNALYDIPFVDRFSLYVGGGIGALYTSWDASFSPSEFAPEMKAVDNNSGWAFAYQAIVGVAYELTPNMAVTAGYRGWSATALDTQFSTMSFPWMNIVEVGLRVSF